MGRLREKLIQQYAEHYSAVNKRIDDKLADPATARARQLIYGDLVDSLPPGSKILDVGCGAGSFLQWVSSKPGVVAKGVDKSWGQVEAARDLLPGVEILCEDGAEYLRNNSETFHGIFCMDVLEHIEGEDSLLEWVESAFHALCEGGFFCCRMPNAANLTSNYSRYMDITHERCFTATSALQLLNAAGLRECRILPIQAAHFTGRFRLALEAYVHRIVFRLCGRGSERIFTSNICAVGYRK